MKIPTTPIDATFSANWNAQKPKMKVQFPNLTDADLAYEDGKRDELLARLQAKLGKTRQEVEVIIAAL